MRAIVLLASLVAIAAPAAAQSVPVISIRPFGEVTQQAFAAKDTFNAVFGQSTGTFFGAGVQVTIVDQFYGEVRGSQFKKTGDRVFVINGDVIHLGLPLSATLTPIELTGGFRFRVVRHGDPVLWLRPYVGAGVGWYSYEETCTAPAAACAAIVADYSAKHTGFVLNGGVEFRLHEWVGVSADAQFRRVTGIIGTDGASHAFSEGDIGGVGVRFRAIVGR